MRDQSPEVYKGYNAVKRDEIAANTAHLLLDHLPDGPKLGSPTCLNCSS
ncbi:hypothetical protein [Bradyrhizobium sp. ORS 86]